MIKNEPTQPMTDEEFAAQEADIERFHGPDEVEDTSWAVDLPTPSAALQRQMGRMKSMSGTLS